MSDRFPFDQLAIRLHPRDNVAIALKTISAGTVLELNLQKITLAGEIPVGHKFALEEVSPGGEVRRYGYLIGCATRTIHAGEWVHSHNLEAGAVERSYQYQLVSAPGWRPDRRRTFWGYPRQHGRVGARNYVAVISTVNCSASSLSAGSWSPTFRSPARIRRSIWSTIRSTSTSKRGASGSAMMQKESSIW